MSRKIHCSFFPKLIFTLQPAQGYFLLSSFSVLRVVNDNLKCLMFQIQSNRCSSKNYNELKYLQNLIFNRKHFCSDGHYVVISFALSTLKYSSIYCPNLPGP